MYRRIWLSMLIISLLAFLGIGASVAYFFDDETSSGNQFQTGTIDLKLFDQDEGPIDGLAVTWQMPNMMPGDTTGPASVFLQNAGNIDADHVEISFSHVIDEASNPVESDTNPNSTSGEMAGWLEILSMEYFGLDLEALVSDANGNGWIDLQDVTDPANSAVFDNLSPPPKNGVGLRWFSMKLRLYPDETSAINEIQGDKLTTTVTFRLNQNASQ